MSEQLVTKNEQFYSECTKYFEGLRKKGKNDDAFEDEFFFTMPAISGIK
ncbi:MAG: hypothetical protein R3327_07615 [Nitrosopumilaceae archaeon]|nr:hypothetical protein [Nitrosopumilaceae archaeon]